jgi:hypothetical protein
MGWSAIKLADAKASQAVKTNRQAMHLEENAQKLNVNPRSINLVADCNFAFLTLARSMKGQGVSISVRLLGRHPFFPFS